jgi:hypothetical protein
LLTVAPSANNTVLPVADIGLIVKLCALAALQK